ncbi:phage tail protein [Morganella morganii]|uniref:phage tail protein n=1 Tax=Morganella morganii TaxID=582 RepID=UPI00280D589B|nr:phage tail protein [Morganella morganii]
MTAKYFAILTNYGAAQLANAVALGTQMNISAMAVGDGGGTLPVPDPAQTKLVRETRRAAVNQVSIDEKNPNFIIAEQVIPENEGGWWIREIGLFDDTGGLIAVGNAPETYKPNLQEGSGRTQVIQMVLMVSSTQAITLKVDPSVVLATREYVTKSIDAAIQASETKTAKIYATKNELSSGLSGKQPTGDYATKTEVNSKLTKNENGKDIPDKTKFIENLGLPELLDKKLDKTGGKIIGQLNIEYVGGQGLTTKATAGTSVYHELYLIDKMVAWWGVVNKNEVVIENRATGQKLFIGPGGFKIDGKDIATTDQLFGVGQTYKNLTSSRQNKVWYTNTDSKPRIIHVESNRTGTQYPFSIDIQVIDASGNNRVDYRWTSVDEVISLNALVQPGERYSVNGGWGQPAEWVVINRWVELSQ